MVGRGIDPTHLDALVSEDFSQVCRYELPIIAIGLLIFRAAFNIKYGMSPWIRFKPASVSEALSEATNWWKTVEARLKAK
jgi:hypothetical protein